MSNSPVSTSNPWIKDSELPRLEGNAVIQGSGAGNDTRRSTETSWNFLWIELFRASPSALWCTGESNCLLRKELHPSDSGRILDAQYERGLYFDELCRRAEEFAWTGHDEARYRLEYISNRAQDSRGGCSCHNDEVKYLTDQLLPRLDGDFAMFQGHWL
jgi:hypothetical protein